MATAQSGRDEDNGADTVSVNNVIAFLRKTDGKARHADLVHHFRRPLTDPDPRVKGQARQEFRDILQRITAIKTENGEKYVILTKASQRVDKLPPPAPRKTPRARQDIDQSAPTFTHLNAVLGSQGHRERGASSSLPTEDESGSTHGGSPTLTNRSSTSSSTVVTDSGIDSETQSVSDTSSMRQPSSSKSFDSLDSDVYSQSGQDLDDLGLDYEFSAEDKQWMLSAAFGNLDRLKKMLEKNPSMVSKRDCITGFAAIHWGAKLGRKDIVQLMIDKGVDVNLRTRGGHTALHLAAMHGHDTILIVLIDKYHVNKDIRDYSGKKAKDVVKDTVAADIQRKLGRSLILDRTIHVDHGVIKRSDSWTTFLPSDSPRGTPETHRRKDRTMSFLKKKKKLYGERAYGSEDNLDREEKVKREKRPKSQVIISAPELDPMDRDRCMTQPTRSFEI